MTWFYLSLFSAASKAANQALTKILTKDYSVLSIAAFGQMSAAILILPLIFIPGLIYFPADVSFYKAAAVTISINIIAIMMLIEAIRRSDLSYAIPFLGLTPVFTIITGWFLRGELISFNGMAGIFFVFFGAFGIDTKSPSDWITLGGKRIFRDKGVLLVICVALLYSVSSVYDKTATMLSDPYTYVWYSAIIRGCVLLMVWFGKFILSGAKHSYHDLSPADFFLFTGLGITFTTEALFQMFALQTGMVAYVIAIKRLSILMTSLIGMAVYKEFFSWARLGGATLIVLGAGIIYLS